MPMDRSQYPANWQQLSLSIKEAANWTCQQCSRPCRKPGVDWNSFAHWLEAHHPDWWSNLGEEVLDKETGTWNYKDKPQRFTLTVAHLDQNPDNNETSNLKALCASCHLAHDRPWVRHNRRRKQERAGQMQLTL